MTNPSPDLMRMLIAGAVLSALAGCDSDAKEKAAAMRAFTETCAVPVGAVMALSAYGSTITLTCASFKLDTKGVSNGK